MAVSGPETPGTGVAAPPAGPPSEPAVAATAPPVAVARPPFLLRPFAFARRRPLRALGYAFVTLLLGAGVFWGSLYAWYWHNLRAARTAIARGHNAEAARYLLSCQWVRPASPDVRLLMARVARRSGAFDEAEHILDELWREYGDGDALVFERLLLRAAQGQLESAAPPLMARIAAGGPDAEAAREALASGAIYRFQWADADRFLTDWLAAEPGNTAALLLKGKLQEQRVLTDDALATYRRIVELDPDHDEARFRLTTVLMSRFNAEEAMGHLDRLRARLPGNAEVDYQWVTALGLQGRTAEARAALDEALRAHPDHAGLLAERGKYAALDHDDVAAADYLGRAARLTPSNQTIRHQYAHALVRLGRTAEADAEQAAIDRFKQDMDELTRIIAGPLQQTPKDPAVHYQLALIALRSGQPAEGLRWLNSALRVNPDYQPAHQTLAGFYQAAGNPVLAARHRALAKKASGGKS